MDVSRRAVRVRLIAGLLACAWALVPLGTLVDALATEHVYCAEHNAIEHAGAGGGAAPARATGIASLQASTDADGEHGEGCPFTQMVAREYRAPQQLAVAEAPRAIATEHPAVESDRPPLPVLAFAPKSS